MMYTLSVRLRCTDRRPRSGPRDRQMCPLQSCNPRQSTLTCPLRPLTVRPPRPLLRPRHLHQRPLRRVDFVCNLVLPSPDFILQLPICSRSREHRSPWSANGRGVAARAAAAAAAVVAAAAAVVPTAAAVVLTATAVVPRWRGRWWLRPAALTTSVTTAAAGAVAAVARAVIAAAAAVA